MKMNDYIDVSKNNSDYSDKILKKFNDFTKQTITVDMGLFMHKQDNNRFQSPQNFLQLVELEPIIKQDKAGKDRKTKVYDTDLLVKKTVVEYEKYIKAENKKKKPETEEKKTKEKKKILSKEIQEINGVKCMVIETEEKKADYISKPSIKPLSILFYVYLRLFYREINQAYKDNFVLSEYINTCTGLSKTIFNCSNKSNLDNFPIKGSINEKFEEQITKFYRNACDELTLFCKNAFNNISKISINDKNELSSAFVKFLFHLLFEASIKRYTGSLTINVDIITSILQEEDLRSETSTGLLEIVKEANELHATILKNIKPPPKGKKATETKEETKEETNENKEIEF